MARQVIAQLYEGMLRVPRLGLVGEIFVEIARRKTAADQV